MGCALPPEAAAPNFSSFMVWLWTPGLFRKSSQISASIKNSFSSRSFDHVIITSQRKTLRVPGSSSIWQNFLSGKLGTGDLNKVKPCSQGAWNLAEKKRNFETVVIWYKNRSIEGTENTTEKEKSTKERKNEWMNYGRKTSTWRK